MEEKQPILISACLVGVCCRYDGKSTLIDHIEQLKKQYHLIPVCPEVYGGLPTPRESAEKIEKRVVTASGLDVTDSFTKGSLQCLQLGLLLGCKKAILQDRSPSCGYGKIYDGTFSGRTIKGNGLFAELLEKQGFLIVSSSQIEVLLQQKGELKTSLPAEMECSC
ncbi:MAG: DUF523 domain-containing protein [Sphaerochaeta sp.]